MISFFITTFIMTDLSPIPRRRRSSGSRRRAAGSPRAKQQVFSVVLLSAKHDLDFSEPFGMPSTLPRMPSFVVGCVDLELLET